MPRRSRSARPNAAETLPFGGDSWGRDVLKKTIKGAQVSIFVGVVSALVATLIGTVFGALAGYFRGWLDDVFEWFYSVFTSIPYILLILAFAAVFRSSPLLSHAGILTIITVLALTGWTGIYRLVRAEYIKQRAREYVRAADAIGASNASRMFVHILPNASHVILVQLSLHVVAFIKAEVILSFLGMGVPVDMVSWGTMLAEAQNELVIGKWWQLVAAGARAWPILVTAFALFTDSVAGRARSRSSTDRPRPTYTSMTATSAESLINIRAVAVGRPTCASTSRSPARTVCSMPSRA